MNSDAVIVHDDGSSSSLAEYGVAMSAKLWHIEKDSIKLHADSAWGTLWLASTSTDHVATEIYKITAIFSKDGHSGNWKVAHVHRSHSVALDSTSAVPENV